MPAGPFENTRQPTPSIPNGGNPCFFLDDAPYVRIVIAALLRGLPERLSERPRIILVVSGTW